MLRFATIFLFVCLVFAQDDGFQDYVTIDSFETTTSNIVIVIPANPSFPLISTRSVSGDGIFGGERDARLIANSGTTNTLLVLGVDNLEFFCSTPEEASGSALLQYDGFDGSPSLVPAGLFGTEFSNDLTRDNVFAFHMTIESDIATTIQVKVYSGSATDSCAYVLPIPGDDLAHDYYLNFNEFTLQGAGCDFTNVGAIELLVNMFVNVDVIVSKFNTYGPIPATPTRSRTPTPTISDVTGTPTRSPTPSPSTVPTLSPSPSPTPTISDVTGTPTRSPTPSPSTVPTLSPSPSPTPSVSPDICNCVCPTFRCALFRYDDNDNNKHALDGSFLESLVADFVMGLNLFNIN